MIFNSLSAQALADLVIALQTGREPGVHFRIRQETDALRESGSLTAVAWDVEGITRKALAETLADAMADERESVPAGGSERFTPRSGTVKELVRAVTVDGITDPAAVLAEVGADKPDASEETVERMVRLHRVNGSG
ncbi:hypothetical protein [Streptomyces mirabilis]|uniref:hypothetical protein n=1 Tax=Streptomyces mirabilis TaxID=68239 RepID=UPI002E3263E4|nr:hypothetical protein [Streptomyces mirabilis]